jgi:hypothetical protein
MLYEYSTKEQQAAKPYYLYDDFGTLHIAVRVLLLLYNDFSRTGA